MKRPQSSQKGGKLAFGGNSLGLLIHIQFEETLRPERVRQVDC